MLVNTLSDAVSEDVFEKFKHQLDQELTTDELRDLVEFLNGL